MPNSTTRRKPSKAADKPAKPRPDFPLFPHATGRWAKKVQGSLLYFGPTKGDTRGDKAVKLWLEEKDYCLAHGRRPRKSSGKLLVPDLVNRVLNDKRLKVQQRRLDAPHLQDVVQRRRDGRTAIRDATAR